MTGLAAPYQAEKDARQRLGRSGAVADEVRSRVPATVGLGFVDALQVVVDLAQQLLDALVDQFERDLPVGPARSVERAAVGCAGGVGRRGGPGCGLAPRCPVALVTPFGK
ncbi:hypothetical protein D3C78_1278040 [compost metagenome]